MTATLGLWALLGGIAFAVFVGFAAGVAVMWNPVPKSPGPGQPPTSPPGGTRSPLPRAGRFPTEPLSLLSEHHAQLDAHEREIRDLTGHAWQLYGHLGYLP